MNLMLDGPYFVADNLLVKLRSHKQPYTMWVGSTGQVTLALATKSWRRTPAPPDTDLVGVYTTSAKCQQIRDDLAERLAEIAQ